MTAQIEARLAILAERERVAWGEYLATLPSTDEAGYEATERLAWHRLATELADVKRLRRAVEFEQQHEMNGVLA